ncbi:MAG: GNAT family N-acetyltransferase [Burkholderiaceae bacterium]|jgi:hypothetical protein
MDERRGVIEVRCYNSLAEAAFLRSEMNAVNLASSRPDPFSTFEFLENFLRHDDSPAEGSAPAVWFVTAFVSNELVGYLGLKLVKHRTLGFPTATLSLLATHDTDRPQLVARSEYVKEVKEAIYAYLLSRRREWALLEFHQQDDESSLFLPPNGLTLRGYYLREWPSMENCTIPIGWSSLQEYFQAIPAKFRANVRRQLRHLIAYGRLELLGSSDSSVTPFLLELYRTIEPFSWKADAYASIGRHPKRIEYFQGLLQASQPMRISIQVLLLDGTPIAGLITGTFGGHLYALQIVYDERFQRGAPGSAILLMGIRQAIESGCASFNMLSGFGYYKVRWLARLTSTRVAQIYRVGGPLFWSRLFGDARRRLHWGRSPPIAQSFNPAHRKAHLAKMEGVDRDHHAPRNDPVEQERIAALIEKVRSGPCEFLSSEQLASAMPIRTGADQQS